MSWHDAIGLSLTSRVCLEADEIVQTGSFMQHTVPEEPLCQHRTARRDSRVSIQAYIHRLVTIYCTAEQSRVSFIECDKRTNTDRNTVHVNTELK